MSIVTAHPKDKPAKVVESRKIYVDQFVGKDGINIRMDGSTETTHCKKL